MWTLNLDSFFYPVTEQDRAHFFTVNIQVGAEHNVSAIYFLDFSLRSYNMHALKPN